MEFEQRRNIKLISTAGRAETPRHHSKAGTKGENACINIEPHSTCPFTINHLRKNIIRRPVSRVLFPLRGDDHSSALRLATQLVRPTRMTRGIPRAARSCLHPYSVLLQVGLAVPPSLRSGRCALTAPFHPYLSRPLTLKGGLLSAALSLGSPPPGATRHLDSMEPGLSSITPFPAS